MMNEVKESHTNNMVHENHEHEKHNHKSNQKHKSHKHEKSHHHHDHKHGESCNHDHDEKHPHKHSQKGDSHHDKHDHDHSHKKHKHKHEKHKHKHEKKHKHSHPLETHDDHDHGHHDHHNHDHHYHKTKKSEKRIFGQKLFKFICMLIMVFGYFIVELVIGIVGNSLSLVSDSFHMLGDSLSLVIGLGALILSTKSRTKSNTYGWGRSQILGGMINAVFLLSVVFFIFFEAFHRFMEGEPISNPWLVFIVGIIGLIINILGLILFGHNDHGHDHGHDHGGHGHDHGHGHSHDNEDDEFQRLGHLETCQKRWVWPKFVTADKTNVHSHDEMDQEKKGLLQNNDDDCECDMEEYKKSQKKKKKKKKKISVNMMGVFLHIFGDFLGSIAVCIASIFCIVFPPVIIHTVSPDGLETESQCLQNCLIPYVDPIASCILACITLCTTLPLFFRSSKILLQCVPPKTDVNMLQNAIVSQCKDDVIGIHGFHIWTLVGDKIVCSMHVSCKEGADFVKVAYKIKTILHTYGIHSVTIQPEYADGDHVIKDGQCGLPCITNECITKSCCPEVKIRRKKISKRRHKKHKHKHEHHDEHKHEHKHGENCSHDHDHDHGNKKIHHDDDDDEEVKKIEVVIDESLKVSEEKK